MLSEVEPPAAQAAAGPSPKEPVAEGLLTALQPFLSEALVSQVGACYQFNISLPGGTQSIYFLDLSAGTAALPCPHHHVGTQPLPAVWGESRAAGLRPRSRASVSPWSVGRSQAGPPVPRARDVPASHPLLPVSL